MVGRASFKTVSQLAAYSVFRYFPSSRKGSDNESDVSFSRRRR